MTMSAEPSTARRSPPYQAQPAFLAGKPIDQASPALWSTTLAPPRPRPALGRARRACCARRRRLSWLGLAYTPTAVLALFAPKCPLCLGALLAVLGVTGAAPSYAIIVLASLALGTLALLGRTVYAWRRQRATTSTSSR